MIKKLAILIALVVGLPATAGAESFAQGEPAQRRLAVAKVTSFDYGRLYVHTPERQDLPSAVVMESPAAIDEYLWSHPDVADVVRDMAVALIDEFRGEPSKILLSVEVDDYVDASNLVFIVRVATYDDRLVDRLERVAARFDDRLTRSSGWVYATTDHAPLEPQ